MELDPGTVGERIGEGNVAEVFAYGEKVLKLYRDKDAWPAAQREADNHRIVQSLDLPVPRLTGLCEWRGRPGLVFERAEGVPLALSGEGDARGVVETMAQLHRQVLACRSTQLHPLRERLRRNIARQDALAPERKTELLAQLDALPEGDQVGHGDFHPLNIICGPSRCLIIDWADATAAPRAADIARSYLILLLHAAPLAEPYRQAMTGSVVSRADLAAWLPVVAGARLAETVAGEREGLLALDARLRMSHKGQHY